MITARLQKYVTDCRTLPGDIMGAWRAGGTASAWLELRRRTVDRAGGYAHMLVIETDLSGLAPVRLPPGVDIVSFSGPDWSSLGDLVGERLAARFTAASAAGRQCIVARRGGQAVGYSWVSPAMEARYEGFELPLPADAIYIWQTQVALAERGTGIGSALVSMDLQLARARGYRRSWTLVHPENTASLRIGAAVAPSWVVGAVTRVKVLSSTRSWYRELPTPRPLAKLLLT